LKAGVVNLVNVFAIGRFNNGNKQRFFLKKRRIKLFVLE